MQIKKSEILGLATQDVYHRGLKHHEGDRVKIVEVENDFVSAEVKSRPTTQVSVHRNGHQFVTSCSCPQKNVCEHVIAALLSAERRYVNRVENEQSPNANGKSHAGANNAVKEHAGNWREFITAIHHSNASLQGKNDRPKSSGTHAWKLYFDLDLRYDAWSLTPYRSRLLKDGQLGKAKLVLGRDKASPRSSYLTQKENLAMVMLENFGTRQSRSSYPFGYHDDSEDEGYQFSYGAKHGFLFDLLRTSLVFLSNDQEKRHPIKVSPHSAEFEVHITEEDDQLMLRNNLLIDGKTVPFSKDLRVLMSNPIWILRDHELVKIKGSPPLEYVLSLRTQGPLIEVPRDEIHDFFAALENLTGLWSHAIFPELEAIPTVDRFSSKKIELEERMDLLILNLSFDYAGKSVRWQLPNQEADSRQPEAQIFPGKDAAGKLRFLKLHRNAEDEQEVIDTILATGARQSASGEFVLRESRAVDWLLFDLPRLEAEGFEIHGEEKLTEFKVNRATPKMQMAVHSEIDWFDCRMSIDYDGVALSLKELRKSLVHKTSYVKLADGSTALLPDSWKKQFGYLLNLGEMNQNHLKVSRQHVTLIDALFDDNENKETDAEFQQSLKKLQSFEGIESVALSRHFRGKLRGYQQRGLDWLCFLQEFRFGGCLADDMGLGKTIQTLALLQREYDRGVAEASVIICPTSVLFNWEKEIEQFTPKLRVLVHAGPDRRRTRNFEGYDLVLCSYGILRRDIAFLKDVQFHYVILDESQHIKNPASQTAKAARLLEAKHRLVLTGTPVENSTIELWSQFNFLNPGMLGSLRYFKNSFAKLIERDRDRETVSLLRKIVFPFILRRTKDEVATDLPAKIENQFFCDMGDEQRKLYNQWRDYYRAHVMQFIDSEGLNRSRMYVLEGLTCLRQICCHPKLIDQEKNLKSGKFEALKELLQGIIAEGHKVIVFSQFVRMLSIIRRYVEKENVSYAYLDGQTKDRKDVVEKFQTDESTRLFLISLKAGGFGLNLTAADYVILFDPWWNPATESQAIDRTHRIGQDKKVFAYKMIVRDSVEEKILKLQQRKKELVEDLIATDTSVFKHLTATDIEGLFS